MGEEGWVLKDHSPSGSISGEEGEHRTERGHPRLTNLPSQDRVVLFWTGFGGGLSCPASSSLDPNYQKDAMQLIGQVGEIKRDLANKMAKGEVEVGQTGKMVKPEGMGDSRNSFRERSSFCRLVKRKRDWKSSVPESPRPLRLRAMT